MNKHLFTAVMQACSLRNHAAVAARLDTTPSQISKMNTELLLVGPKIILSVHERVGFPVSKIRELIAQDRK
jgi:hypothetical protein